MKHWPTALWAFRRPLLLFAGLALAILAFLSLPLGADPAAWRDLIGPQNAAGVASFIVIVALATGVGIPRQAAAFVGGLLFGTWLGVGLAICGQVLGACLDFYWARWLARDWVQRRLPLKLQRLDQFLTANAFTATLTIRLLPVGNNMVLNMAAGASSIKPLPFLVGSAVGYVPQTLIFALLGGGAHVGSTTEVWFSIGLFAASLILGARLYHRRRREWRPDATRS